MPVKKVFLLAGTRPNYMKIAPLWRAIRARAPGLSPVIIHTGQHYDRTMSDVFFEDLDLPRPDVSLAVGSGSHAEQTARVMTALEPVLRAERPDALVVVGDVNSTMAGALAAVKLGIPVAHVEAGLRSFDRTMPEEINRLVTDAVADLLFTSCRDAGDNLRREGIPEDRIFFAGNIMIDSLVAILPKLRSSAIPDLLPLSGNPCVCVTLHRPFNVDHPETLREILDSLAACMDKADVVFPVHPRTRKIMEQIGWTPPGKPFHVLAPLGYIDFMRLMTGAAVVVTDSGGIQEETTYLGIPCLTLRPNTERPITISQGTNRLIQATRADMVPAILNALDRPRGPAPVIEGWDGKAADRILDVLKGRY